MTESELKTKSVAIIGFGQEGQAVAEYLHKLQINFAIFDNRPMAEMNEATQQLLESFQTNLLDFNEDNLELLSNAEVIFRSPGVPWNHPLIQSCQESGSVITSQTEFFFQNFQGHIIGITGTKGKGTTSTLIYELLQNGFPELSSGNIYLTGNIGKVQPLEFLSKTDENTIVVYELSSFQLQDLKQSPQTAVVLMITQDHLDHHKDLEEYHKAKSSIAKFQQSGDVVIYNQDYDPTKQIGEASLGKKFVVTSKVSEVEQGVAIQGNMINVYENQKIASRLDCSDRRLRGQHNMENIAAAVLAVKQFDFYDEVITRTINEFRGLEHRLEFAGKVDGITFINDSIATLPESTLAALKSFTEPTILILGGSDKGLDFDSFINELNTVANLKAILFFGQTGLLLRQKIATEIPSKFIDLGHQTNLEASLKAIKQIAEEGDVVLLSPAAASFDYFKNYKERGQIFKDIVKDWQTL